MKTIKKAVKEILKFTKKRVDFVSVSSFLNGKGYAIIMYDADKGHKLIDELGLEEYSQKTQAFAVRDEINSLVFVRCTASPEDKLYLLLHITGHIVLNHLETNMSTVNTRFQDIEADAFAYMLLHSQRE